MAVDAAGLAFVGPGPEAIRSAGDKLEAKRLAREAGIPVVESGEPDESGYPLIVKAAAGGGGRGMRVVRSPDELQEALEAASRSRDGLPRRPRVLRALRRASAPRRDPGLADSHGTTIHLGERDCRSSAPPPKVLEESPSPALTRPARGHG